MARELSQEELLDFLCQAGGRVTNAALLGHFKRFLRDPGAAPEQLQRRRELFKGFVNSVAAVRLDPDGTKCVVLKKRYRDLVGEEGLRGSGGEPQPSAQQQPSAPQQQQPRPPRAPAPSPGSRRRGPRPRPQKQPQPRPRPRSPPQAEPQPQEYQRRPQVRPQPQPQPQPQAQAPPQQQPRPQEQRPGPQSPPHPEPQPRQQQPRPQVRLEEQQSQSPPPQPQLQGVRSPPQEKKPEAEAAGAGATAPEIECNGLSAGESTDAPGEAATAGPASQARVRCAAAGAQGNCWRECVQESLWAGSTELLLRSHGSPPVEEQQAPEPSSGGPLEDTLCSNSSSSTRPSPRPTALPPPQETFRASGTSPSLPSLIFPGDGADLLALSGLHSYTAQQQQRTLEWVANHSPPVADSSVAERTHQSPSRAWCVLPENFPLMSSNWSPPAPEGLPPLPVSPPLSPQEPSVFRSIRCQLFLQDLDFVEEDNHESEESTSGPRESPGELEEAPKGPLENGGQENLRTQSGHFLTSQQENSPVNKSQGLVFRGGYSLQHIPARVPDPVVVSAKTPRESSIQLPDPAPCPTSRLKRSLRRNSRAGRDKISSSEEELLEEDLMKRNRRPPRSRKLSRVGAAPCPKVDAPLTLKPTDPKAVSEQRLAESVWVPPGNVSSVLVSLRPSMHKSSLVPLESREHQWIVRLASDSWGQALALFWEDPQLALRKDFLTGYTALHWIAKHGNLQALQDLVKGAQKAGIILDVNVKSSCGYTPLHLAAIHGHQSIIKLLVQRLESRVNVRDSSGKKPWQYLTSNTTGEIWQLLGGPKGKPIFPVYSLVRSSSPTRKAKSHSVSRNISRKTSLAALLKSQHNKWKMAHQYDKFHPPGEREEYSD